MADVLLRARPSRSQTATDRSPQTLIVSSYPSNDPPLPLREFDCATARSSASTGPLLAFCG
jgi:hypothetical protein